MRTLFLSLVIGLAIIGCERPPKHPDTPTIEYRGMDVAYVPADSNNQPSTHVTLKLYFTDGTGDLGLTAADSLGKYQQIKDSKIIDGEKRNTYNRYFTNYWVDLYVKREGQYVLWRSPDEYHIDASNFYGKDGRFRPFNNNYTSDKNPIEGFLNYEFQLQSRLTATETIEPELLPGDTVKFSVRILDRKLNISNEVTTPDIQILMP